MVVPLLLTARSFSHAVQFTERFYEVYAKLGDRKRRGGGDHEHNAGSQRARHPHRHLRHHRGGSGADPGHGQALHLLRHVGGMVDPDRRGADFAAAGHPAGARQPAACNRRRRGRSATPADPVPRHAGQPEHRPARTLDHAGGSAGFGLRHLHGSPDQGGKPGGRQQPVVAGFRIQHGGAGDQSQFPRHQYPGNRARGERPERSGLGGAGDRYGHHAEQAAAIHGEQRRSTTE